MCLRPVLSAVDPAWLGPLWAFATTLVFFLLSIGLLECGYKLEGLRPLIAPLFQVGELRIDGNYKLSRSSLLKLAGLERVKDGAAFPIWKLSSERLRRSLLSSPWVEDVELRWGVYPLRLEISLREAQPWLVMEFEGDSWLVSRSGLPLQPLSAIADPDLIFESSKFARLDGLSVVDSGRGRLGSANLRFAYALKAIRMLEMAGGAPYDVERYTLLADGALLIRPVDYKSPEVVIRAGAYAGLAEKLDRYRYVLGDLLRRGETVNRVDLRYRDRAILS